MPSAVLKNASSAMLMDQPREMDTAAERRIRGVGASSHDQIGPERKKPHKQSLDYIWRTGLAGGLAGSAVCDLPSNLAISLRLNFRRPKR